MKSLNPQPNQMAGLMQNDVILGYADDSSVKDEFRGIEVRPRERGLRFPICTK